MYGQKNYNELQGRNNPVNGKKPKYSIRQIGCLLVAMSNLLKERFGVQVDPLQLNAFFRDRSVYIDVDDGVLDDLFWQAVTVFAPHVVVESTSTSKNKLPSHTKAIVKMKDNNAFGTHFCLYDGDEHVIDSWDGQRKHRNQFGDVLSYATYKDATPQPVAPVTPPVVPVAAPAPNPDHMTVQAGWGISHCLKFRGYPQSDYSNPAKWQWVANLNGVASYGDFKLKAGQVIILPSYKAPEPVPPVAPAEVPPVAEVVVATPEPAAPSEPAAEQTINVVVKSWKDTFSQAGTGTYVSNRSLRVEDQEGLHMPLQLRRKTKVTVAGTFEKDGKLYYRSVRHTHKQQWYGIPEDALDTEHAENDFSNLDMDLKEEAREAMQGISFRQWLLQIIATIQGNFSRKK